jgi:hypothetical protein
MPEPNDKPTTSTDTTPFSEPLMAVNSDSVTNTNPENSAQAQPVSNTNNINNTNSIYGDNQMSYANIASSLTSVVTSLVGAITNFLSGIAQFIAQNSDIFVALAVAGIIIGVISRFASSLPFVGNFLSYLGL